MFSRKRSADEEPHTPQSIVTDRARFNQWLAERQRHFDDVNASPADIASLALTSGFSEPIVRQWEQHKRWEESGAA